MVTQLKIHAGTEPIWTWDKTWAEWRTRDGLHKITATNPLSLSSKEFTLWEWIGNGRWMQIGGAKTIPATKRKFTMLIKNLPIETGV